MITDAQVQLFTDKIADAIKRLDKLERRQPRAGAPVPFGKNYRAVYTASVITMTAQPAIGGSTSVVGGWSLTGGTDQGITVSNDSTGASNGLLTLPAGLWRADVFWNNSGGGYSVSNDSCDYWLSDDAGSVTYFGTAGRPGNFTASSTATGEIEAAQGATLKITYYSTFAWTRDLTISLRRVG